MADANRAKAIVVVLMVTVLSAACGTTADSRAAEADGVYWFWGQSPPP